jgi:uncharacterized protein (TIGR02145 family)
LIEAKRGWEILNKKIEMKTRILAIAVFINFISLTFNLLAQSVGINATGSLPESSALLDLSSTNKGFLITRVDTANIVSPAFGLMTLAPTDSCLYLYNGINWMGMGGGGSNCSCNCSSSGGTAAIFPCGGTAIPIIDITSTTGEIWMDRNLGASQAATSSTDAASFGDIYQWGRCSDGHEKRSSFTTTTVSLTDTPGNSNFIMTTNAPFDWRSPQNNNLWQGLTGINNPCPTGYRIPTESELNAERLSWSSNDSAGAFGSPLKLPMGGFRFYNTGSIGYVDINGYYWSSTVSGTEAQSLAFLSSFAYISTDDRAYGFSVRCIKD